MKLHHLWSGLQKAFQPEDVPLPPPGLYHYLRERCDDRSRLHLRVDPDGRGTLLVNASRLFHLNPTAASMAYLTLEDEDDAQIIRLITRRYRISVRQARLDYTDFKSRLHELIRPDGACPIHDLEVDIIAPFSAHPLAPYRMDLALTYRCNNDCGHCYNIRGGEDQSVGTNAELSTAEWQRVIDRLWDQGIPHILFTGGEPTLRDDLPELIEYAERKGQITGLNTNGRRLSDPAYLQSLIDAGLDHVQITLESDDPLIHDQMVCRKGAWQQTVAAIRNALASRLYVMTNTTMLRDNVATLGQTLDFLAELGVPTVGLNALIYAGRGAQVGSGLAESELYPLLNLARQRTSHHNQRLIWYTPTQYCHFDPVQMELGVKGCTAALYNMCIEPDGGVIPCQSAYRQVGNMLKDDWKTIWEHELCVRLRERRYAPEECKACALLAECGAGCPLKLDMPLSLISA
ncbi:MAG: radical SAM protein [Chloroflexota bacterium]